MVLWLGTSSGMDSVAITSASPIESSLSTTTFKVRVSLLVEMTLSSSGGNDLATFYGTALEKIYMAHNSEKFMFGADHEMMTLDARGGMYWGGVSSVSKDGRVLTLSSDPQPHDYSPKMLSNFSGSFVGVLEGTGAGTYTRLMANSGRTFKLQAALPLRLDSSSNITAMQLYGMSARCIVAWNVGVRMNGFQAWGLWSLDWQPSWHNQFLANTIEVGNAWGGITSSLTAHTTGEQCGNFTGPLDRGIVMRGNVLKSNANIMLQGTLADVLCEHNIVRDADSGIVVNITAKTSGIWFRGNAFDGVPKEQQFVVSLGWPIPGPCSTLVMLEQSGYNSMVAERSGVILVNSVLGTLVAVAFSSWHFGSSCIFDHGLSVAGAPPKDLHHEYIC
eukprot:CAMPEP_0180688430 /NCGR_PEP_ID=MMETSP1037_2-20121125/73970_1 /TAXON_ID=632150 /ORGANISM="Azadinium spinosum, Strain 3D9" /LENGTH=388 /DNA_ID=CAMNT_0022719257 /DNA_START=61 /DNA_END=1228 /DNA_ORIENTATION=-